jgi:hypothetical protein
MDDTSSKLAPMASIYEIYAKIEEEDCVRCWKYIVCQFELIIKDSITPEKWCVNEPDVTHLK